MAAQYIPIKRISLLDAPIRAEKLDGSLFTTENQAHEFIISVRKNGVKQTVTGSVSGKFIRANGTTIFLQGSIVDGDAVVRLHQDCYNVQGRFTFNIFNTQSGVTTCIYSAVGKIDMGSTETVIDAGDVVPDVSDVVAAQEAAQAAITAANTAAQTANTAAQNVGSIVARPYSSSSTYTAGDYCTNNGNLYKANQDISTAEEWTASHWTQIVMGDEVADLKSAITLESNALNMTFSADSSGKIINASGNIVSANGFHYTDLLEVFYGYIDVDYTNNAGAITLRVHGYDSNGQWIRQLWNKAVANRESNSIRIDIPDDIKYIRMNCPESNFTVSIINEFTLKDNVEITDDHLTRLDDDINLIKHVYFDADYFGIESGTISQAGNDVEDATRCRTQRYIPKEYALNILNTMPETYKFGLHFYNLAQNHIGYTAWIPDRSYQVNASDDCAYIRFVFSRLNNTTVSTDDITRIGKSIFAIGENISSKIEEIDSLLDDEAPKSGTYYGEKIPSALNDFDYAVAFTMSYSGKTSQDMDIYNGYLFVAFSGTESIRIYDLSTKAVVADIEVNTQHGTGMQFSTEFYSETDEFPLLYCGGWTDNIINVIRFEHADDVWSATVVKQIKIPDGNGYYLAPSLDNVNHVLYCYGYRNAALSPANNAMVLVRADLTSLVSTGDFYVPAILSKQETPYIGLMQGRKFYGGKLFVAFGESNVAGSTKLVTIDAASGDVCSVVALPDGESEGVCYEISDRDIVWYYSYYYRVFKLFF